jgi:hypothetical protein
MLGRLPDATFCTREPSHVRERALHSVGRFFQSCSRRSGSEKRRFCASGSLRKSTPAQCPDVLPPCSRYLPIATLGHQRDHMPSELLLSSIGRREEGQRAALQFAIAPALPVELRAMDGCRPDLQRVTTGVRARTRCRTGRPRAAWPMLPPPTVGASIGRYMSRIGSRTRHSHPRSG